MFKNMKIGIKILLVVLIMSLGTLLVVFLNAYFSMGSLSDEFQRTNISLGLTASDDSKEALQSQAEEYLGRIAQKQALYSNEELQEISRMVTSLAGYIEYLYANSERFEGRELPLPDQTIDGEASSKYMLAPKVKTTDEIDRELETLSNCEAIFGPQLAENDMLDNIYVGTKSGISYRYSRSNLYNPDYDPRERDWYQEAMENPDQTIWLDTYTDPYGHICITCAKAYRDSQGNAAGVIASDIKLQDMLDEITTAKIGQSGYAFVLDRNGKLIAHPDYFTEGFVPEITAHIQTESGQEDASQPQEGENGDVASLIQGEGENGGIASLVQNDGESNGIVSLVLDGIDSYVAYSVLAETGWSLCISVDREEVIEPAVATKETIDQITDEAQELTQGMLSDTMKRFIIFFAVVGIMVIMISFAVAGSITRPIQKLSKNVERIGKGEFDQKVEVESSDEIGILADAFNNMLDDLHDYIEKLTTVTAEKERIGAELDLATQIQADMLPSIFPAFPGRREFDIYATMTPAKEVGGDFYDFFLIDGDHLGIVMADVSGKGVPAALFMVIAKTLIKNRCQMVTTDGQPYSTAEILSFVNEQLCEGNEAELFVTVWLGILQISTGKVIASNAGHEYPAVCRAGGVYELIKTKNSPAVAAMEGMRFREYEFELYPGDSLYIYTDGVPEAMDNKNELFGNERMLTVLNEDPAASADELLSRIQERIDAFVGSAPQFDDITMLCLKYYGDEGRQEENAECKLQIEAIPENLDQVLDLVNTRLEKASCPMKVQTQIDVAVEELFVNVANYAYAPGTGQAMISMKIEENPRRAEICLADNGTPYNPLERDDPDTTLSAEDRAIGGLGIHIVKKSMDTVSYEYKDGQNRITIKKSW